jgi:hypothetical protein
MMIEAVPISARIAGTPRLSVCWDACSVRNVDFGSVKAYYSTLMRSVTVALQMPTGAMYKIS